MEIRLANNSDIPGLIHLLKQVGEVHHQIRPDLFRSGAQKYNEADLEELLKDTARPVFAAFADGAMLGYCFCMVKEVKDSTVLCDDKSLYIDDLCVDQNRRHQGLGKKLYQEVCRYAKMRRADTITLNVWCCNEGAMAFYQKLGLLPQKIGMEIKL